MSVMPSPRFSQFLNLKILEGVYPEPKIETFVSVQDDKEELFTNSSDGIATFALNLLDLEGKVNEISFRQRSGRNRGMMSPVRRKDLSRATVDLEGIVRLSPYDCTYKEQRLPYHEG
jgi:hypothetical protein